LIRLSHDGSFELDMDYFSFHYSPEKTFNGKFEALFGEPRDPRDHFFTSTSGHPSYFREKPDNFNELANRNQYYADVAASIQKVTEDVILNMALHVHQETGLKKLCMAGGVALNSAANGRILRETPFEEIFIQPSAGDGGGALGAALYAYHTVLGQPRKFTMEHAYWVRSTLPRISKSFSWKKVSLPRNSTTKKRCWRGSLTCCARGKSSAGSKAGSSGAHELSEIEASWRIPAGPK